MRGPTWKAWQAKVLAEYMRLGGDDRHMSEMAMDHWDHLLRDFFKEGLKPTDAAKAMLFDGFVEGDI